MLQGADHRLIELNVEWVLADLAGEPQPLHEVDAVGFFDPDAAPDIAFKSTWWALEQWALVQRDRRLRR